MKNSLLLLAALVAISYCSLAQIQTPAASPDQTISQNIGLSSVQIQYSRPSMRGRVIFGDLVPFDKVWRTGANKNTLITFNSDAMIGGSALKAGTYALYSMPSEQEWTVYFYTETDNRGLPATWEENKIAAMYKVSAQPSHQTVETFTISIDSITNSGGELVLSWENLTVSIPMSFDTERAVMESIERTMSGPSDRDYYEAAVYFLNANKEIEQAQAWINKAIEMRRSPAYWYYRQKSLIYAKAGDEKGAIEAAQRSLELAEKAGNQDYVALNKKSLAEWKK